MGWGRLLRAISVILVVVIYLGPVTHVTAQAIVYPDDVVFNGTEKTIISNKFATPTGVAGKSFTLHNLVPHYHTAGVLNTTFDGTVYWDGDAVAAALIPAILEDYTYSDPGFEGQIVAKHPTMVGLIAVFRGSHHEGSIGSMYWTKDYKLKKGELYLHVAVQQIIYQYTIEINTTQTNLVEVAEQAWVEARAGISADLKLLDFVEAGLDLASVEAGVSYTVKYESRTSTEYIYKVTFSIPTYKIIVNYEAIMNVTEILNTYQHGNGPTPTSMSHILNLSPASTYTYNYKLKAVGTYEAYSDYMDIQPYTAYEDINGHNTTGLLVLDQQS